MPPGGAGREVGTGQWPRPPLHALVPSRHQCFPASLPSGLQGGSGGAAGNPPHSPRQPELADGRPSPCPSLLSLGDGSPGPPAAELIPHPQAPVMGGGARCGRPPRAQVPTSDGISAALQRPGRPQPIYILPSELEWCGQGPNPQDPQAGPQPPVQATLTLSPGRGGGAAAKEKVMRSKVPGGMRDAEDTRAAGTSSASGGCEASTPVCSPPAPRGAPPRPLLPDTHCATHQPRGLPGPVSAHGLLPSEAGLALGRRRGGPRPWAGPSSA